MYLYDLLMSGQAVMLSGLCIYVPRFGLLLLCALC
jgi:hypothetical protein